MEFGYLAGWFGLACGLAVAPPQLVRIIKTKQTKGISLVTYVALFFALVGYLIHAIYLGAEVFILAQAINLSTNSVILFLLIKKRKD